MVYASVPGVMPCRVTVQSWLPGTPLERALTADNLWKMGALFARLHAFSATFQPPANFTTRRVETNPGLDPRIDGRRLAGRTAQPGGDCGRMGGDVG
jgi:Ser/Thr protein kinase RdoA (MazF antagonist)